MLLQGMGGKLTPLYLIFKFSSFYIPTPGSSLLTHPVSPLLTSHSFFGGSKKPSLGKSKSVPSFLTTTHPFLTQVSRGYPILDPFGNFPLRRSSFQIMRPPQGSNMRLVRGRQSVLKGWLQEALSFPIQSKEQSTTIWHLLQVLKRLSHM